MSNKKQTAVEWLVEQIDNKDMGEIPMWIYDFIEQAKEMDKQQKIEDYRAGRTDQQSDKLGKSYNRRAANYYKENYEQ